MPCSLLCIVWAVLLAGFLVGVATAAFASPQALGLAGAALVVLAVLYILYCGVCRWALCVLLGIAIFILAVVGMWVAGVAMPGLGGAALIALVFLLLALFIRWRYCR
ncbi:MAG TPA: hypothetical protein VHG28_14085 [Longimicrobiaceae bacterium]|nr:hypothetical protein [Longimicrobiaceae bacterium]